MSWADQGLYSMLAAEYSALAWEAKFLWSTYLLYLSLRSARRHRVDAYGAVFPDSEFSGNLPIAQQ
jgi:hypothetical protein